MPQISLYIDKTTLKRVEEAAAEREQSISKWVGELIRSRVEPTYPTDFATLYGSVSEPLARPDQGTYDADASRESL
jgi:hypothetical protein